MTIAERRKAVKAQLDRAVMGHKRRSQLTREYTILTAALLAEKIEAEKGWPRLEPCAQVNPVLWEGWCRSQGRDTTPSDHWTEFDVVNHIAAKAVRNALEAPALP
jgi:hypothetical protein